jgi:hypothetical protein
MLASKSVKLFNGNMETHDTHNARLRNRGPHGGSSTGLTASHPERAAAPDSAGIGWSASGLMDQMLAYREWWNLPSRRSQGGGKVPSRSIKTEAFR